MLYISLPEQSIWRIHRPLWHVVLFNWTAPSEGTPRRPHTSHPRNNDLGWSSDSARLMRSSLAWASCFFTPVLDHTHSTRARFSPERYAKILELDRSLQDLTNVQSPLEMDTSHALTFRVYAHCSVSSTFDLWPSDRGSLLMRRGSCAALCIQKFWRN